MTPKKSFDRWLSYQNFARHWDGSEFGEIARLLRKAFEAGRKFENERAAQEMLKFVDANWKDPKTGVVWTIGKLKQH